MKLPIFKKVKSEKREKKNKIKIMNYKLNNTPELKIIKKKSLIIFSQSLILQSLYLSNSLNYRSSRWIEKTQLLFTTNFSLILFTIFRLAFVRNDKETFISN